MTQPAVDKINTLLRFRTEYSAAGERGALAHDSANPTLDRLGDTGLIAKVE
jgi:hypothetical protein